MGEASSPDEDASGLPTRLQAPAIRPMSKARRSRLNRQRRGPTRIAASVRNGSSSGASRSSAVRDATVSDARSGSPPGTADVDRMRPLAKDGLTALKQDQQVGGTVVVDVLDGTQRLTRGRVEFLDQVDPIVEVAIRLATHEGAAHVILVNIRSAVEIGIDGHLGS